MVHVTTPAPHPGPGPAGPDIDELRLAFDDLLMDSSDLSGTGDKNVKSVRDEQVMALEAAHELLADALTALDSRH